MDATCYVYIDNFAQISFDIDSIICKLMLIRIHSCQCLNWGHTGTRNFADFWHKFLWHTWLANNVVFSKQTEMSVSNDSDLAVACKNVSAAGSLLACPLHSRKLFRILCISNCQSQLLETRHWSETLTSWIIQVSCLCDMGIAFYAVDVSAVWFWAYDMCHNILMQ
jgi:hypothetical protein